MELRPISQQKIFHYETGEERVLRQIRTGDLILDHEFATKHAGFALRFNNDKRNGYYVEIGAAHWQKSNNTYVLEQEFDWKGVAIDIVPLLVDDYNNNRKNECVLGDAMSYDWSKYFSDNNFPERIDYLQIDIDMDPDYANLFALLNMPLGRYRFNTITLEHCANMNPRIAKVRDMQREILFAYGYELVASGFDEDWWIDSKLEISGSEYNSITYETWAGRFI